MPHGSLSSAAKADRLTRDECRGVATEKRNVLKERPLARGLSSSTAREGYGLAAGMCAGAMPTSYVWTLSSLELPAEAPRQVSLAVARPRVHARDHDRHAGPLLPDLARGPRAVEPRHRVVQQDHVR